MITKRNSLRIGFVFLFLCLLYVIIIFNLYLIQIRQHSFFHDLGQKQYHVALTTNPPRAPIYDRTGHNPLALNKHMVSAFIVPRQVHEHENLSPFLQKHFPHAHKKYMNNKTSSFMFVQRNLTPQQQTFIKNADLKDIQLLQEPHRFYPLTCAAPTVGVTDVDNKGLFGIELTCNTQLAGKESTCLLEQDARSGHFYFKKEQFKQGKNGTPVQLTIDSDLQFLAHEELKETVNKFNAREGAVIIMNPKNGEVIAMATEPTFNPNKSVPANLELTKNSIITESYELGSVFKAFTALAALEEKIVTPNEPIDCKNKKTAYLDGRKVNTWKAHGVIPFAEVVQVSNNIGIAQVAKRLDYLLYDHYTRLGFASKTNIELPGEQTGFINHPANWSKQSIISLSYGYEVRATLLQLARAFAIIANNGHMVQPHLILGKQTTPSKKLYSDETIKQMRTILHETTQTGTARRANIKGYTVMSKTGTANILQNGQYNERKNMYTCAGIVEKGDYQRVIVTFVKEAAHPNLFASIVAAPLFERIAQKTIIHDKVV